jgi:hypothetical protein
MRSSRLSLARPRRTRKRLLACGRAVPWPAAFSFRAGVLAACLAGWLLTSACAPRGNVAITTVPSSEELPVLRRVERVSQAAIAIEGGPVLTESRLVPDFKEPELTAEEKAALGPEPVHFKFLPYNELSLPPGSILGPWYAGISTAIDRASRIVGLFNRQRALVGVAGWAGATGSVDSYSSHVVGTYDSRDKTTFTGPRSAIDVGTDPVPSRIATREPHKTP